MCHEYPDIASPQDFVHQRYGMLLHMLHPSLGVQIRFGGDLHA